MTDKASFRVGRQIANLSIAWPGIDVGGRLVGEIDDLRYEDRPLSGNVEIAALAGCNLRTDHGAGRDRDDPCKPGPDPGRALQFPQIAWRPHPDLDDPASDQPPRRWRANCRSGDRALAKDRFLDRAHVALCPAARNA